MSERTPPRPVVIVIEEVARDRLGFAQLHPGQLRAVDALAGDRDVLAVLPTGGGKSAVYELAGLLRAGPTIVVSPLIALQDDQLAHLRASGLPAIVLNSQQSAGAHAAALLASCDSNTFVFLSPQQLAIREARETLMRARPGLFAVDEAHLISQWGHDFRSDYMMLGAQSEAVGAPVRLALTATAPPPVRTEIIRRLHAGLSARQRHDAMAAFLRGSARIIAATVAFGIGIEKPDVRWLVHCDPPSEVRLRYRYQDFDTARHLTAGGVSGAPVARVAAALAAGEPAEHGTRQQTAALARLADLGTATWQVDGKVCWSGAMSVS